MAVLTDQNLVEYKKALDVLNTEVNKWTSYLNNAKQLISSGTGSAFRTKYAKGKKASQNIQSIIDILQSLQNDLKALIADATTFYNTSYNAGVSSNSGRVSKLYGCPVAESVENAITEAELYSELDTVVKTVSIS